MSIIQLQSSSLSQSDPASFKILFHKYEGFPKLPQCTSGCLKTKIFWQSSYILRRPQNFAKSSPYFWLQYIESKVRWRFRKILWPSQNIWTLHQSQKQSHIFPKFKAAISHLIVAWEFLQCIFKSQVMRLVEYF